MNKVIIVICGFIILLSLFLSAYFYLSLITRKNHNSQTTQQISPAKYALRPSPSPTPSNIYCKSGDIQASLTLSPGAGNIYGTFMLRNISQKTCKVQGSEYIIPRYNTKLVKNINITHVGQQKEQSYMLSPDQTLYSQVHYPNGPQCQSIGLVQTKVTFTYDISPNELITYKSSDGKIEQIVQTCKSASDITEISVWNMATQPITK